jgi:hypothetical protein
MEPTGRAFAGAPVRTEVSKASRLVEGTDGSMFTEDWDGTAWVAGDTEVRDVMMGAPLSPTEAAELGIP